MAKWLTKKEDIKNATDEDLQRSLITSDGMGKNFKTTVLHELLLRRTKKAARDTLLLAQAHLKRKAEK